MKTVQILSEEYVQRSAQLSTMERLEFLEEFRLLLPLSVFEEDHTNRLEAWYGANSDKTH